MKGELYIRVVFLLRILSKLRFEGVSSPAQNNKEMSYVVFRDGDVYTQRERQAANPL